MMVYADEVTYVMTESLPRISKTPSLLLFIGNLSYF